MKNLITILFIFSAFISNAQNLNKITGLESTAASVAYSLRQLSSSYSGPLVRIKVGASFYDVYPDASTTKFSLSSKISAAISPYTAAVAAAGTSALSTIISGSTDATVAIWYDQSGNGVHVLSNNSSPNAKIITAGSINTIFGQPTIYFSGSNSSLGSSTTVDYSALSGATVNAVAQNVATTSGYAGIIGTGATPVTYPGYNISYSSSSGYGSDGHNGFYSTSVTSTDPKIVTTIFINNTTNLSKIYVNKELKTNVAGTSNTYAVYNTSGSKIFIGVSRSIGSTSTFIGNISEAILFPSQLSDAIRNPLETNQSQTYLGPSVTITSSASGAVCAGTNITFTAVASNISTPTYQWTKNGIGIPGANSSTYSSTTLSNNDEIKVWVNAGINPSSIVSNGLKLNLDASNPGSYSGSGNTWYDLSGNNNHATLNNSPTYDAVSASIVTNGTNQYISVPQISTSITNVTMQAWVYVNLNTKGPFIKNGTAGGGYAIGIGNAAYDQVGSNVNMLVYGSPGWINTGVSYGTAGWKLVTMTMDGSSTARAYVNGTLIGTYTTTPNASFTGALNFGANIGDQNVYYNGKFAAAYFYDRALSLAEIQQNYDAFATKTTGYSSNTITASITGSTPTLTITGDGCVNKTTLTTPAGASAYAWLKDNVAISNTNSSNYTPTTAGVYKVQVTSGSCTNTSTVTTIYACAKTPEGKMLPITSSTTMVATSGEISNKNGVDERGLILTNSVTPITTGLMLYLDATKSASYGGSGTTWNDISGQLPAGSATLVGNPPFSSGSFTFGDNMNASTSKTYTISNLLTLIAWVNPSQIQSAFTGVIFRRTSYDGGGTGMFISGNNLHYDWDNSDWSWRSDLLVPNDQWSMIVISVKETELTAYLCNASGISSVIRGKGHGSLSSKGATNFHIGLDPYPGRQFKGKMGTAMVYSVGLSTADITTIFNAQKAAFGIN